MSSHKRIASDEERFRWHIRAHSPAFPLPSQQAAGPHGRGLLKLTVIYGVLIVVEYVGHEVAAALRRSQERRHRIADDHDLERLLAADSHFARDVGLSPEQRLSGLF
jgi:hypothetical protein